MPKLYQCRVCDEWRYSQSSPLWKGIPWIAYLDGDYCCQVCHDAHDSPGKFSQARGFHRSELGKALILYSWSGDCSYQDDSMSNEGWGYCGRFGRYLLFEDTSGFVTFEEFDSDEKANKRFDELYCAGMGASEDDFYIQAGRNGIEVWQSYKQIHVWPSRNEEYVTERRALAAVSLEMRKQGYYPNVWICGERGDMRLAKGVW